MSSSDMYSDADVTAMCEHERKTGQAEGRESERSDVLSFLEESEWDNATQASVALDILTMLRNGMHRAKR